jgi:hypothetical protein
MISNKKADKYIRIMYGIESSLHVDFPDIAERKKEAITQIGFSDDEAKDIMDDDDEDLLEQMVMDSFTLWIFRRNR